MSIFICDYKSGKRLREPTFFELYRVIEGRYDLHTGTFMSDDDGGPTVFLEGISMNENGEYNQEELENAESLAWDKMIEEDKRRKNDK